MCSTNNKNKDYKKNVSRFASGQLTHSKLNLLCSDFHQSQIRRKLNMRFIKVLIIK